MGQEGRWAARPIIERGLVFKPMGYSPLRGQLIPRPRTTRQPTGGIAAVTLHAAARELPR